MFDVFKNLHPLHGIHPGSGFIQKKEPGPDGKGDAHFQEALVPVGKGVCKGMDHVFGHNLSSSRERRRYTPAPLISRNEGSSNEIPSP